jgi:hypothetical protein
LCMSLVAVGYTVLAMVAEFCTVVTCVLNTKKNVFIKKKLGNILPLFRLYFVNICIIFHIQEETAVI